MDRIAVCTVRVGVCAVRVSVCTVRVAVCTVRVSVCTVRVAVCTVRTAVCTDRVNNENYGKETPIIEIKPLKHGEKRSKNQSRTFAVM